MLVDAMGENRMAGSPDPTTLPPHPARVATRIVAPVTRAASVSNERSWISMDVPRRSRLGTRSGAAGSPRPAHTLSALVHLLELVALLGRQDRLHLLEGGAVGRAQLLFRRVHGQGRLSHRRRVGAVRLQRAPEALVSLACRLRQRLERLPLPAR